MRVKVLKIAVRIGQFVGALGIGFKEWIEYKEWKYWNNEQIEHIDLPGDRFIAIRYDRKGSFVRILFWKWITQPDGKRDLQYIRETIELSFEPTELEVEVVE